MICACVLTIFEFNLRSSSWSTLIYAPWLILMHNYMYMAFIPNPFNILLASPMEQTFLYNLMSLFLHRNCHSLSSLNAYIDVDGFHPPIHPIFFMHCKWNFPSNVYLNASISPLGLSFNYQNHTCSSQLERAKLKLWRDGWLGSTILLFVELLHVPSIPIDILGWTI